MSSVISFAYFTDFSILNISRTNADICKSGKLRFYSFMEFYAIHLKRQGEKFDHAWYHYYSLQDANSLCTQTNFWLSLVSAEIIQL